MSKLKLLLVRIIFTIMLSCSLVPYMPLSMHQACEPVITVHAATRYNRETIKKVQKKLNRRGYDCGTPDGIRGNDTAEAIRQYQKYNDLKVTGTVNSSLLKSLNIKGVKEPAYSSQPDSGSSSGSADTNELTVYITDTGSKYHRGSCRYLSRSKHAISLSDALAAGYDACSVCNP